MVIALSRNVPIGYHVLARSGHPSITGGKPGGVFSMDGALSSADSNSAVREKGAAQARGGYLRCLVGASRRPHE